MLPNLIRGRRWRGAGSAPAGAIAGRSGFALAGRGAVTLSDVFLFIAALEVGFVPAAALEPESNRRNQLLQFRLATTRAFAQFRHEQFQLA